MIEKILFAISQLNVQLILLSAVLFTLGLILSEIVLEKNIRWLIAYPTWMYKIIEKWMKKFSNVIITFIFIVLFNTVNLFIGFLSGYLILIPVILALWTGINVGVIIRQSIGEEYRGSLIWVFLNPVAIFELPASWISFSIAIELGVKYLSSYNYAAVHSLFMDRLSVFIWLVIPLLIIGGLIEAAMIHFLESKIKDDDQ